MVDLAAWRRRRTARDAASDAGGPEHAADVRASAQVDPAVDRLDQAVERLQALVSGGLEVGRLEAKVETELLAIMGELTVGLIREAADRAERLAAELAH